MDQKRPLNRLKIKETKKEENLNKTVKYVFKKNVYKISYNKYLI